MNLPPFLLDRWLEQKQTANPAIDFDLGSSTGPVWTLRQLLGLSNGNELDKMLDTRVLYTAAAGTAPLRKAIAKYISRSRKVSPDLTSRNYKRP